MKSLIKKVLPQGLKFKLIAHRQEKKHQQEDAELAKKHGPEWGKLKEKIKATTSIEEVYKIAEDDFGISQVPYEIFAAVSFVRQHKPQIIGEIGTRRGGNSFLFMNSIESAKRFLGMDLRVSNRSKLLATKPKNQQVSFFEGDSQGEFCAWRTRNWLKGDKFDFLFIDGDHNYAGVKNDYKLYKSMVKKGGLIAFHDICQGDVVGEEQGDKIIWAGGVPRFWQEVKQGHEAHEFVENWDEHGFGIGIIINK